MTKNFIYLCFILLIPFPQLSAEFIQNFFSPMTTKGGLVFYPGSLLTFAVNNYEENKISYDAKAESQENITSQKKRVSHYGDLLGQGLLNGSYIIYQWVSGNSDNASLMFSASFYSTLLTWILKTTVREKRPLGQNRYSFPSGHTSLAFAYGTVLAIQHPWYIGLWGITIASFIGYSRIIDNAHWLHDVIGGATIGASYALGLSGNYSGNNHLVLAPMPTPDLRGIQLKIAFSY